MQVSLESDKSNVLHMKTDIRFRAYVAQFFLAQEIFQTKVVGGKKTRFMPNDFFFKHRTVYEVMCRNIVQPGRPQTTIWRMLIACWIPKATNTHSEYVTLIACPPQSYVIRTVPILLKCKLLPSSPYMTSLDWTLCNIRFLTQDVSGDRSATVVTSKVMNPTVASIVRVNFYPPSW
jgi:hypothetical protein